MEGGGANWPEVGMVVRLLHHQRRVCTVWLSTEVTRRFDSSGESRGRADFGCWKQSGVHDWTLADFPSIHFHFYADPCLSSAFQVFPKTHKRLTTRFTEQFISFLWRNTVVYITLLTRRHFCAKWIKITCTSHDMCESAILFAIHVALLENTDCGRVVRG